MNGSFTSGRIRKAQSQDLDPRQAVRAFHAAVSSPKMALVVFFCSSHYDLDVIAAEINACFHGVPVIGCTTAGEIGPSGYRQHSISGFSLPADDFSVALGHVESLDSFNPAAANAIVSRLLGRLGKPGTFHGSHYFALQLIDGLSNQEEIVTQAFQQALGGIALFGGSAGDDLRIESTCVFSDHAFRRNSTVLAIIETVAPFTIFKTQNFIGGHDRFVVTQADAESRTIYELNGEPAVQVYARATGVTVDALDDNHFSDFPVVVRLHGMDYVRSIQKANRDGSLTFYCAIERGLILRIGQSLDFTGNLASVLDNVRSKVGEPELLIACDCVLRQIEMKEKGWQSEVEQLFEQNNTVGFSTYGEQFMGIHMNQTLSGLAIGYGRGEHDV
ncbi:uncharacterized protein NMK_0057 [Novimethylophilus kurashikiensis]|uniref:FIST domain containing protein n=1 Tax=Novimethylophilus kurashikiensis TaxID=1825523 RepID=A0A2R5F1B1_9PROT|nr:FIST N-terminal domain-containing protein [Novimethylophilus kurashikiensis]GBG12526.1 uncharacterized protein NMK_0057 [Novimethylophilus kurashikiensis]